MKTRSKGFTLIELLAVIVILAIIALIATPTILGVIEKARKGSAEASALGFVDAVEKQIAINTLDSSKNDILDGPYDTVDLMGTTYGVTIKGKRPETGSWVKVERNQVVDYSLKIGDYVVNYDSTNNKAEALKNGEIKTKPTGGSTPSNPTPSEPTVPLVSYYAFGDPTDESIRKTDYNQVGHNVFVKLEGEQKYVCILKDGEVYCLKNDNAVEYYDQDTGLPATGFAGITCRKTGSSVLCGSTDFICNATTTGYVNCNDRTNGNNENCNVDAYGVANCS